MTVEESIPLEINDAARERYDLFQLGIIRSRVTALTAERGIEDVEDIRSIYAQFLTHFSFFKDLNKLRDNVNNDAVIKVIDYGVTLQIERLLQS